MFYKNLRYFVEACQCRSIAAAAEKLFISRQALSLTLRRFEEEVGVPLFERNVRGITLTEQGQLFFEKCRRILADYEEALDLVRRRGEEKKETVRVAFSLIALKDLTVAAISQYERENPSVRLVFSSMVSEDAWASLARRKLDMVCSVYPPESYGFHSRLVKEGNPHLLVSARSELATHRTVTLWDLEGQVLLNSQKQEHLMTRAAQGNIRLRYRYVSNDPMLIGAAVRQGLGVYAVPKNTLSQFDMQDMAAIPFDGDEPDLNLYLTCLDPQALSPAAGRFCEYLCALGKKRTED